MVITSFFSVRPRPRAPSGCRQNVPPFSILSRILLKVAASFNFVHFTSATSLGVFFCFDICYIDCKFSVSSLNAQQRQFFHFHVSAFSIQLYWGAKNSSVFSKDLCFLIFIKDFLFFNVFTFHGRWPLNFRLVQYVAVFCVEVQRAPFARAEAALAGTLASLAPN